MDADFSFVFFIFLTAQRPTEAEVMPLDNTPPDEDDLSVKTVVELRKMVKTAVMADGNIMR